MKMFVCLTMVVALCACGAAVAQDTARILEYDGQVLELAAPAVTPTLGEVLGAYAVALDEPDSVNPFLREVLREIVSSPSEIYTLEVSWIGAEPPFDPMLEPLSVAVDAAIGSDTALIDLHVSNGSLHADVTRYDRDGQPTSVKVQCEILEPIAILETAGEPQPVQTYYLAGTVTMLCTCDDGKGVKGCTATMCDNMKTCPSGPNGVSCGWITPITGIE